jgi:hypothetical protein
LLQAVEDILAVVVVLIQHRDLSVRMIGREILAVDPSFVEERRLKCHRPGKIPRIVPFRSAAADEQMRDLLRVDVFVDGGVGGNPEHAEQQQDLVVLHQPARLLDRLGRAVRVVITDEPDGAAIDAALSVDLVKIRCLGLAEQAPCRSLTAVGHGVADLDLCIGCPGIVFLFPGEGGTANARCEQRCVAH